MNKEGCLTKARALRADASAHYNCAQAAIIALRPEDGPDEADCVRMGAFFGSGMRCGSVCGAVTGALMALGLQGAGEKSGQELLRRFRDKNGALNCAELLKAAAQRGEERKSHCDRMVFDAVEMAAEIMEGEA